MMVFNNFRNKLPRPKITFDRLGQIVFVLREVVKLAFKIKPKLLITAFVLNALWGFLAVPGFYMQKLILDKLVQSVGATDIKPILISTGILMFIALMLSLLRNFISGITDFLRKALAERFEAELTIIIGKKLSTIDMAMMDQPSFQDRFNKTERESGRRAWGLMMPLSDIPNYLVGFMSSVAVLLFVHPLVAVGVFFASLPQIFIDSKYIKKGYELHTELSPLRRMWNWLDMYLFRNRNYMEYKLLDISDHLSAKLQNVVEEILDRRYDLNRKRQISRTGSFIPLTVFELGISILLIFWVIVRRITVGSFQLYISSLRSAEQNLAGLVSSFLELYENYFYVTDLVWFLDIKPVLEAENKGLNISSLDRLNIKFEDVWFKYKEDQPWVLKGVNFEIKNGERIALVGENGAGKSTLISLISRFYDPQKGKILVNNKDLTRFSVKSWRKNMSVMFQQFEEYPFTAQEAIGYGDIRRVNSLKDVKEAAVLTGIDEYIGKLPLKYQTPLTERFEKGVKPSLGQRQRIGIARALFRKEAKLLILDEPTSNIDPEAEEDIFQQLVKISKNKMLVFVTQRFSTVRIADRILVMSGGKIIEDGTHRSLMEKQGKYAKMFNIQAKAYLNQ